MPCPQPRLAIALLLALCLRGGSVGGKEAAPAGWPHLRGPKYDALSTETGLIEAWPEGGPPMLWTRELGQGYSGFVGAGGRVFTQFQTRTGLFVLALDADTGAEVWRQRVDWPWQPAGPYPGPYATPTCHDGKLYYSTPNGLVGCLAADDGRSLWSVDTRQRFRGEGTEFGYAITPVVEDGKVILPVGGPGASVVALNADDGSTVWAAGDDAASYCPAYPVTLGGRRLVIALLRNVLAAHDLASGKVLWRHELSADYDEHSAWPLYVEPHLLIALPFRGGARLFQLEPDKARAVWANRELSNDICSSVLVGGQVYGFDLHQAQASPHRPSRGQFKCLELTTGKVRWETDRVGHATVLAADGKLILLNDSGTLILARCNPDAYEELARAKVLDGGLCWTQPTLWQGRLYVRNQSRAACVFLGPPDSLDPDRPAAVLPQETAFDWSRLLTREPDFPHDEPSAAELARWFGWCVGAVFGGAALVGGLVGFTAWMLGRRPHLWGSVAFAAAAFLLGLVGTTVFSAWADAFILTWPASLYVAFRVVLEVIVWAEAQPVKRRLRLVSRTVTLLFLALGYGYYRLCLAVGYVMAWSFLAGFLPAALPAIVAARARKPWLRGLADGVAFTVYFWTSGMFPAWKSQWFG